MVAYNESNNSVGFVTAVLCVCKYFQSLCSRFMLDLSVGAGLAWCILFRIGVTHCWKYLPSIALEQHLPTSQRRTIHSDIVLASAIREFVVRCLSIYPYHLIFL